LGEAGHVKYNLIFGLGTESLDLDGKCPRNSTMIIDIKRAFRKYGADGLSQQS